MEVLIIAKLDHQLNEEIRDKEVRVIGADGAQLGIMTAAAANAMAEEQELDLVKISPNAVPPVCKLMDYGKFRFEQAKKEKEARKNQKVVDIKEVRLSAKIDVADFNVRVKQAEKFLKSGDKVKASIRFRGREMAHTDIGLTVMQRFAEACAEFGTIEKAAKLEGRLTSIADQAASYDPASLELAENCDVITSGVYVGLFFSNHYDAMSAAFQSAVG